MEMIRNNRIVIDVFKIKFVLFLYLLLSASWKENDLSWYISVIRQTVRYRTPVFTQPFSLNNLIDICLLQKMYKNSLSWVTLKRHLSIGVFVLYIDTRSPVPNIPSKSSGLEDENKKFLIIFCKRYQLNYFICIKDFNAQIIASLKLNLFLFLYLLLSASWKEGNDSKQPHCMVSYITTSIRSVPISTWIESLIPTHCKVSWLAR
jgi:hypothetical protein